MVLRTQKWPLKSDSLIEGSELNIFVNITEMNDNMGQWQQSSFYYINYVTTNRKDQDFYEGKLE